MAVEVILKEVRQMRGDRSWEDIPDQVLIYEKKEDSAVIWRCFSREDQAVIPARVEGLTVTELAPYCFSAYMDLMQLERGLNNGTLHATGEEKLPALCGDALHGLVLPPAVRRAGRYCFYNCEQLQYLEFFSGLTDWGSGVFTGCHQMREIRLHLDQTERSMLKEVLDEVPEALKVEYLVEGEKTEKAVLVFPEFYEEGVENTPARILETHVHGSGILYRNCFRSRVFDFSQYDRLFPYAKAREDFEVTAELVTGRLWHPCHLTPEARRQYEEYVEEERESFAVLFSERKDMQGIRWLTGLLGEKHPEIYDRLMELAGRKQFVEAVSYLMEQKHRQETPQTGRKRRRMEL